MFNHLENTSFSGLSVRNDVFTKDTSINLLLYMHSLFISLINQPHEAITLKFLSLICPTASPFSTFTDLYLIPEAAFIIDDAALSVPL